MFPESPCCYARSGTGPQEIPIPFMARINESHAKRGRMERPRQ